MPTLLDGRMSINYITTWRKEKSSHYLDGRRSSAQIARWRKVACSHYERQMVKCSRYQMAEDRVLTLLYGGSSAHIIG